MGARVRAYDPAGMEQAKAVMADVMYCDEPYSCAEGADALVIATEWEQFRALDFDRLRQVMASPVLVDLKNVYRAEVVQAKAFAYASVGRPPIKTPRSVRAAGANNVSMNLGRDEISGVPRASEKIARKGYVPGTVVAR